MKNCIIDGPSDILVLLTLGIILVGMLLSWTVMRMAIFT